MPRVQMTRTVRIALGALVVYLALLLTLIGIKFVKTFLSVRSASHPPQNQGAHP